MLTQQHADPVCLAPVCVCQSGSSWGCVFAWWLSRLEWAGVCAAGTCSNLRCT